MCVSQLKKKRKKGTCWPPICAVLEHDVVVPEVAVADGDELAGADLAHGARAGEAGGNEREVPGFHVRVCQ